MLDYNCQFVKHQQILEKDRRFFSLPGSSNIKNPRERQNILRLSEFVKFIKYHRRKEYFAVCWICPILNQYQRRTPEKVYFLFRIHQPQVTPVQFRLINARILYWFKSWFLLMLWTKILSQIFVTWSLDLVLRLLRSDKSKWQLGIKNVTVSL